MDHISQLLLSAAMGGGGGDRHEGIEDYEAEDPRDPFGDDDFDDDEPFYEPQMGMGRSVPVGQPAAVQAFGSGGDAGALSRPPVANLPSRMQSSGHGGPRLGGTHQEPVSASGALGGPGLSGRPRLGGGAAGGLNMGNSFQLQGAAAVNRAHVQAMQ